MENRKILISDICSLNQRSLTKDDNFNIIEYLDTGSIANNKIESTQLLTVGIDEIPSRAKRKVKPGSIIYSTVRPNQEHFGFLENPPDNFIVSTGFTTIDVTDKNIDSKYIYYAITQKYITNYLHSIAENSVSSYPSINPSDIGKLTFSIPVQKSEQEKISKVLAVIDTKIELNNRINAELEAMAKNLYDYWFVQLEFPFDFAQGKPAANGKPYKSSGGKMVYNPTLKREIPVGWDAAIVADGLGKTPSSNKVLNKEIMNVGSIPVIDQSQEYICGFTDDTTALIKPTQPHVVFGDHTRAVKLVNFEYARGADGTQILLSNDSRMPGYLLYQVVSDIDLSNYGYARHFKFLKDFKIILPNEIIAARYHEVVAPLYEKTLYMTKKKPVENVAKY